MPIQNDLDNTNFHSQVMLVLVSMLAHACDTSTKKLRQGNFEFQILSKTNV